MSEKNLIDENNDSDDDEEDDDFCPTKNQDEKSDHSDESDDDSNDEEPEKEQTDNQKQTDLNVTPYDESKTNDLWKSFTSSAKSSSSTTTADSSKVATPKEAAKPTIEKETPKATTNKIFEFAGEKVSVPVTTPAADTSLKRPAPSSTSGSILDRLGLGKKQKISTLEKSRLDWDSHKQTESLTEDLDLHRRGKDSYVEKTAFLQRSEMREHDNYLNNIKKK